MLSTTLVKMRAFTLIELMVSIAITAILAVIAIPNYSNFIVQMRVDNEISQLHRLLLLTRNFAINTGLPATLCPLNDQQQCHSQWQAELSVFIDLNDNQVYEPTNGEELLKIKPLIKQTDKLQYGIGRTRIKFAPTGRTSGWGSNGTFIYCPKDHPQASRALSIRTSGRFYTSTDSNNDGKDDLRNGKEIQCRA
jgi:type IV fimbrial biogenesis protein FimT